VAYLGILFGRVQQIQLRTEGRENGDLRTVAPWSGVPLNLQMSETRILIRLLWVYFPRNWEFGSALSKLRNFGSGGLNPPTPFGTPLIPNNPGGSQGCFHVWFSPPTCLACQSLLVELGGILKHTSPTTICKGLTNSTRQHVKPLQ
jgi:hypothetical protein